MTSYRKGDRFKYIDVVWEVQAPHSEGTLYYCKIVHDPRNLYSKEIHTWEVTNRDIYLGNFSKSGNFNSLYDKLNSTNDPSNHEI